MNLFTIWAKSRPHLEVVFAACWWLFPNALPDRGIFFQATSDVLNVLPLRWFIASVDLNPDLRLEAYCHGLHRSIS
ncbi:hypothetical protein K474DRAFT_1037383 [Panus rudis PR-1116 ss-1]|nr:hypothetical protein K474DRAFT_1037383 [Panus rudis PR-1116 ss-1]